ncbi:MAG: U32 family peptidase [Gammaproteobacteria bacterium]|nr:U32 family peptidase [Gammaproteobacteria bacterium]
MKLSLGPLLYLWSREKIIDFYTQIADTPVDIIYLGEVICSKRRSMKLADWISLGRELSANGKQVVLSTLALMEAESELSTLRKIVNNNEFMVEANDMAAVQLLSGSSFIAGPHINCYNNMTMSLLNKSGAIRWVMPVELSREALVELQSARPEKMETEVFAFGRLPLSFSARCFTARANGKTKDECAFICGEFEDGLTIHTQEEKPFLTLNGIQMQSASTCNLIGAVNECQALGVDVLRISPQTQGMETIINSYHRVLNEKLSVNEAEKIISDFFSVEPCNGYWYNQPGMEWTKTPV